jgi:catechol 2,3-dioxygenase-like lactoylglutathione lyase family enzyme
MADVVQALHAVTIHIRDIDRARTFYRDVLGLTEVAFHHAASRAVFALPGTTTLLTMHVMGPTEEGREAGTVSGVVFRHDDPAAAIAEFKRRGGTVTLEPTLVEIGPVRFHRAAIADPDGNEFVISDRKD